MHGMTKGCALGEQEKHHEAIEYFDKALKIKPDDAEALINKGIFCMLLIV